MSYRLQKVIHRDSPEPVRGYRSETNKETESVSYYALNCFIFSLIRGNRSQRRALISTMLNMFDDSSVSDIKKEKIILFLLNLCISLSKSGSAFNQENFCWMIDN